MNEGMPRQLFVVGLGYVGLPLAAAFARHLPTVGFDVDGKRVEELRGGRDRNGEVPPEALRSVNLRFSTDPASLREAEFVIVAVPTPVDRAKRPDLTILVEASRLVGHNLQKGATVVYESTVYPGCTEEVCVPILERESGLAAGLGFKVGYSPERINPGDSEHTLESVVKVVAGQDDATAALLARVYGLVVKAGVHRAPDIRTAEAAKVIENTQRDLNIALMNELALLFHRMGLSTRDVLAAARTKWNFLPFEPGLVGGHCIPVDPYYLTHRAEEIGYHPEVILAGRRINDSIGRYVAQEAVKLLIQAGRPVRGARVLVLGITFKENVPDLRNSRVIDLIREIESYGCQVNVYDPLVATDDLSRLNVSFAEDPFRSHTDGGYDAVVLAVPHREFGERGWTANLSLVGDAKPGVFIDVKGIFRDAATAYDNPHDVIYWSL